MQNRNTERVLKIGVVALFAILVGMQVNNFPYPAPLIQPFLEPKARWPEAQVKEWIENENPDQSFVDYFQRDPERFPPAGNNYVAPADGVIKDIIQEEDVTYFVVGLSFWDVHVVRTPISGEVIAVEQEGVSVFRDFSETAERAYLKGKAGPVQQIVTIRNGQGDFKVRLITSWWASRLKVSARVGSFVEKGDRIGRILLGSSVVVDTPKPMEFLVEPKQRVVAGETIIWEGPE